tara:strand:+ start:4821 stop:6110 length:1290 start_codon:yes stop_codon:yes gene_type:complete
VKKRFQIKKGFIGDEDLIPRGNNKLTSLASHYQRGLYDDTAYPELLPDPLDTHSDYNILYGRVNTSGSSILLAEDNLKQILSPSGDTLFVLDFVADAWQDLVTHHAKAMRLNAIETNNTVYKKMNPEKTWQSVHPLYTEHMQNLYGVFTGQHLSSPMNQEIVDFEAFLSHFMSYCGKVAKNIPVTRTSFITSRYASPLSSGLMIELVKGKHDDDYAKYIGFIRDVNFDFFTTACRKFGFLVDKNAPWRIIADVNSSYMRDKMKARGAKVSNTKDVFDFYYLDSMNYEIENIKGFLFQMYELFISQQPDVTKLTTTFRGKDSKTSICYTERRRITRQEFDAKYTDAFWLRVVMYLRAVEVKAPQDQAEFDKCVRHAEKELHWKGLASAIEYVKNKYTHNLSEVHKKNLNFDLTQSKSYDKLINKKPNFQF